ncbi:protein furry homolog-like [Watersipora subatra]|uniref:protein furry homolog-like n=1 Tax=Watersipora subatra TaxID=2589382 RepID=UPI00355B681A
MKRWFGGGKTYDLSSDQSSQKSSKDKPSKSGLDSITGKVVSSSAGDGKSLLVAQENGEVASTVTINLKETTVESAKRSHRRQKSSGNWQMLLGDSPQPSDSNEKSLDKDLIKSKSEEIVLPQPLRVPVSSTEARPLSFFQKISAEEGSHQSVGKPNKAEIFPWGSSKTPSPSSESSSELTDKIREAHLVKTPEVEKPLENQKFKQTRYKKQLSKISQSVGDDLPITSYPNSPELIEKPLPTEANCERQGMTDNIDNTHLVEESNCREDVNEGLSDTDEIIKQVSIASYITDSVADVDKRIDGSSNESKAKHSSLQRTRPIHEFENQHVKRNSDPCSVKRRRNSYNSKRRSFPQTVEDRELGKGSEVEMDMKCEVLKISAVEAEVTADKKAFVLVDPALDKSEGLVKRISLKSFSESVSVERPDGFSDTESERYRLAEAMGETVVDTASEESTSSLQTVEMKPQHLKIPEDSRSYQSSLRKNSMFKSNSELSSHTCRSFDETSVVGSDKESFHSFRSSLSNKSYSVNDLTLLERPSGFGTLDMNRLVGSFQMLDSILSEHTAPTPDNESPSPLATSPVSATLQLLANEDEDDNQSVKSLTIIRNSNDDLTDSGRPSHLSLANASAGITINVDSSSQAQQAQLSPVSAVISLGGSTCDIRHEITETVIEEEEKEPEASLDEVDCITPLPSDRSPDSPTTKDSVNNIAAVMPLANREPFQLPWGARRNQTEGAAEDRPGAFVLRKLFMDFTCLASRKIERVLAEPLERPLQKSLQRGEDAQLDQLLSTLNAVSEHCLPSLIKTLFAWYDRQIPHRHQKIKAKGSRDLLSERRDLAVDFLFCLVLIEILQQLNFHPGYDDLVDKIVQMCFSHFKLNDGAATNPNTQNVNTLSDLYAEVLGVLAKSRFLSVKKRFLLEIKELRGKEQNPVVANQIISLIMGLKFFRVKMHPIEEFEACVQFLHDLGAIFLDTKEREVKHALAGLFVEVMLPMAAIVQTEVNVPVLRNFVEKIYPVAVDMANKRRNSLALYPMVTCLLCVSQKTFFKAHWPMFLTQCITSIRSRDTKMSRVALESLYRLVWVYMIRVKCEANAATTQRLTSIVSALFPKGQKVVMPRDTPLNIYVKMLQFIAREKLDFAMREVIFDLLSVGKRAIATILPERMSIGLRAFLVISDNLQQKDGEPPMPQTVGVMPSGSTLRVKKTFLNKVITDESAKNIGIHSYYPLVRKAFSSILRLLDGQIGKGLMMTKPDNKDKDLDDLINVEKKPKLDLLRTCVAAIPRLMPSNDLSVSELVEMLLRYTVHIDEELKKLAYKALENMLNNFWETRDVILSSFVSFIQHDIPDMHPVLVDSALRMLHSLMIHWKTTSNSSNNSKGEVSPSKGKPESMHVQKQAIHQVEGLALVMLCSCRPGTRKHAVSLLKESHNLMKEILPEEACVITWIDQAIPRILESILPCLPSQDKAQVLFAAGGTIDLQWLVDQTSKVWFSGIGDESLSRISHQSSLVPFDAWVEVLADSGVISLTDTSLCQLDSGVISSTHTFSMCQLDSEVMSLTDTSMCQVESGVISLTDISMCQLDSGILSYDFVKARFPIAASNAWPIVFSRLSALFPLIDPNNAANDQRSSGLLRGSKKITNERDVYINLWHNYIVFGCCLAPSGTALLASQDVSSSMDSTQSADVRPGSAAGSISETSRDLFRMLIPLLKCEILDLRDSCITALGRCSPEALHELCDELMQTIKDVIDRKQESVRRRKKKDSLRLYVAKLFHLLASNKIFAHRCANVIDLKRGCLMPAYTEYIDGMRLLLEGEGERDIQVLQDIRLHYSSFITLLIKHFPAEHKDKLFNTELKYTLFNLLSSWSRSLGHMNPATMSVNWTYRTESFTDLELVAVEAMCAILGCGKIFDPTGISQADGYIYPWLDRLLSCCDAQVNTIGQETCQSLLRYNADTQYLLDWTIDRCYKGTVQVADSCFTTLVKVFTSREYPCDSVAMLNLALLHCGCPRVYIREMATQLLLTLCNRFLMIDDLLLSHTPQESTRSLEDVLITAHCKTQLYLSEELSRLNPELTIQIFSEVCQRIDTAVPSVRHNMFSYLSPWLLNVQLVNPQIPDCAFLPQPSKDNDMLPFTDKGAADTEARSLLQGEGWGSTAATEMVLNNLMYLTVKYGDEHVEALEFLWQELGTAFPCNLAYCLKYLLILSAISPNRLLPYTKRVIVYLARKQSRQVVYELMVELQSVETLPFTVESCPNAPYFKMIPQVKSARSVQTANTQSDETEASAATSLEQELTLTAEEGVVFAKKLSEINPKQSANSSATGSSASHLTQPNDKSPTKERAEPYPLPLPAFGGYYAPLNIFMPSDGPLLINSVQRCFLSLCIMSDLFVDNHTIDWTIHMPTLLQVTLLGCDHSKSLVYEHCKKTLLSLILCVLDRNDRVLSNILEAMTELHSSIYCSVSKSATLSSNASSHARADTNSSLKITHSTLSLTSICTLTPESTELPPFPAKATKSSMVKTAVEYVIELLKSRESRPLWSYETVTPRQKGLKSLTVMSSLLSHLLVIFKQCLPKSLIDLRWCQTSLQFVMRCPSRHYAGRSLQIFRLLGVPMTTQMLSDIMSRLVEVVCENGEEMQGFVTEILQTIEKSVTTLDVGVIGTDSSKDLFISTPNLKSSERAPSTGMLGIRKSNPGSANPGPGRSHKRSTSVSISNITKKAGAVSTASAGNIRQLSESYLNAKQGMGSGDLEHDPEDTRMNTDDKLSTLVQMFWLGASMLESDYEHEFLLAVNLLRQVFHYLKPDRPEVKEKMEKTLWQLKWTKFPGLHSLLVKGLTSPQTCNDTWTLLSQLSLCIRSPIISQGETLGFPVNVMCLLPYMVQNYEEPTDTCLEAADNIAQMALEITNKLDNLATVMRLYSRGAFGKDAHQWTKCVVKYLTDIYDTEYLHIVTLLLEVLEQSPTTTQAAILVILHCVLHYVDISALPTPSMSSDLIATVSKFVEGPHWSEAQKILKLAVKTSSSLIPVSGHSGQGMQAVQGLSSLHTHTSFAEAEVHIKKDLPGRTLDFTFDVSSTPVIGEQFLVSANEKHAAVPKHVPGDNKRSAALSSPSLSSADSCGNWRRPHHSQARVRDRLVNLLATLGHGVGVIKSPSVVFSQMSETVEQQTSLCSSSEETGSVTEQGERTQEDSSMSDQFGEQYFKDFDFLDNETEPEEDNEDKFNWGVKRQHSLNELDMPEVTKHDVLQRITQRRQERCITQETESSGAKSISDEEQERQSVSPVEEVVELPASPERDEVGTVDSDPADSIRSNGSELENGLSGQLTLDTDVPTFLSLSGDEVEICWKSYVDNLMTDTADRATFSGIYNLFCKLYKETKRKLTLLSKEVCFYLGKTPSLRTISSQFSKTLEVLLAQAICPFTYIDPETAGSVGMSNKHKFALLEVHEAYLCYLERREQAQECLENIKSSIKMHSLGTHISDFSGDEQMECCYIYRIEVCNGLYKLQYQLFVLYTTYIKLLESLKEVCQHEEAMNMSDSMSSIAAEMQEAINVIEADSSTPPEIDMTVLTQTGAENKVVELLTNKRYTQCIQFLRTVRHHWPGDRFGLTIADDISACLSIYCNHLVDEKKNGLVVVTRSAVDHSSINRQLLDLRLQLNSVLTHLSQSSKVEVICKTDNSSDSKKTTSPSRLSDFSKPKSADVSPKVRPMDLQLLPASPASRESCSSAPLSPLAGSKGGCRSPSTSASGDETKSLSNGDSVKLTSAL